jgi:tetratricopeptide (TPR) repeat protein
MRLRAFLFVAAISIGAPGVRAQSVRLDQSEILGRLALGYSPSYVAHLVKTRGLTFSPTEDFMYRVRLAGGEGILVERLNSQDAAPSVVSSADQDVPFRRLAKCAELIHAGGVESAEQECRGAIDENPKSPWPLLAVASLMEPDPYSRHVLVAAEPTKTDRVELLQKAAALAPSLAVAHRNLAFAGTPQAGVEMQRATALDPEQFDLYERSSNLMGMGFAMGVGNIAPNLERNSNVTPTDNEIAIPPQLERRLKVDPDLASNHVIVGALYLQASNFEKARQEFNEAVRLEPDEPMPHFLIAATDYMLGQKEAGLAELRETVRISPAGKKQHLAVAGALQEMGRTAEAKDELHATIAMHPAAYEVSNALVEMCMASGDRKCAIGELRRFLDVASTTFTDQRNFVYAYSIDLHNLLKLLAEDQQYDAAAQQFALIARYRPNDAGLRSSYAGILYDLKRFDDALVQYWEAERIDPDYGDVHHNIGLCLAAKKDLEGAIKEFRESAELDPNSPGPHIFLGVVLGQKGDLAGANEQFQLALEESPLKAEAHVSIAYAFEELKDTASAARELKRALELKPEMAEAENDLAWIYATADDPKLRDAKQALVLARQAVANSPQPNAAFVDTLAEALLINGQPEEALKYEQQAVEMEPQNRELQSRLPRFQEAAEAAQARIAKKQ